MLEADEELTVYLREYEENLAHLDMETYYQITMRREREWEAFLSMINDL